MTRHSAGFVPQFQGLREEEPVTMAYLGVR